MTAFEWGCLFYEKLELSEKDSSQFWPIYQDLQNRNMKVNEDERNLLNYYSCNSEAMSEQEVDEMITKFLALQETRLKYNIQYYDKFVTIIGKRKTMHMYALEREFRMYVLGRFRSERGRGEGTGQGRNRRW